MSTTGTAFPRDRRGSSLKPTAPPPAKPSLRGDVGSSKRRGNLDSWLHPGERDILILSTFFKVLLFPAYRSTDFEVHRNWLAITHSLPMSKWYFDTTSEWTLDYPPFFAYFEFILSIPAWLIDARIVQLSNLNYASWSVIVYQRSTVVITELVLASALLRYARAGIDPTTQRVIAASLLFHPGFIIVDHIHFQYNGFMFGVLLWSILMAKEGRHLASGVLFAVLLNFKHIYMYLAPAYFVYLLRSFCMSPDGKFQILPFVSLANSVCAVFVTSFGPFFLLRNGSAQIKQIFSRLFPFTRGLNHAYWAPNAWALVTAMDRVLLKYVRWTGAEIELFEPGVVSTSRGLVGDTVFAVLPNVTPLHTFIITVLCQGVFLIKLWRTPTYKSFLSALILCGWSSFMFGWHVHEKAILLVLVPLSLTAAESSAHLRTFIIASVAGICSLFPLLFTPSESAVKLLYSAIWCSVVFVLLSKRVYEFPDSVLLAVIDRLEKLYLSGFALLLLFVSLYRLRFASSSSSAPQVLGIVSGVSDNGTCLIESGDPLHIGIGGCMPPPTIEAVSSSNAGDGSGMEFLPLMLTSVYCSIGLGWAFLRLSYLYLVKSRK